jgi:phosphate starvation-inducible PhoH-like protein
MAIKKRTKLAKVDTQSIIGSRIDFKKREFNFTEKQQEILKCLFDNDTKVVFLSGPAGTSKSYVAIYAALHILDKDYSKDIIYIRSIIESASKSLGSLPGTESEKCSPFMMPLIDKCEEILEDCSTKRLMDAEKLRSITIILLRGGSLKNIMAILDESQNCQAGELLTVLSRIGENTKVIVLGDADQSDLPPGKSGFVSYMKAFDDPESVSRGIHCFRFDKSDIVRSEILKFIIERVETIPKTGKPL